MNARVLLRNRETGQYFADSLGWTTNCAQAYDFYKVEDAAEFGRTKNLAGMEVVLRYEDFACDLVLPVTQSG
jgi:hypothetical protein